MKNNGEPLTEPSKYNKKALRLVLLILFLVALVLFATSYITTYVEKSNIANEIFLKTGFATGSADNTIVRECFYNSLNNNYTENMVYNYITIDKVLFLLYKSENFYKCSIVYPNSSGNYFNLYKVQKSTNKMNNELDKFFTGALFVYNGGRYSFMLTIDTTEYMTYRSIANKSSEDQNVVNMIMERADNTYSDPDIISISDVNGNPLKRINLDDKNCTAFCDSFISDDKNYKVLIKYKDQDYILTYDDLTNF